MVPSVSDAWSAVFLNCRLISETLEDVPEVKFL
jgi:hypothetical protein